MSQEGIVFPIDALTNNHKLSGLKQYKYIFSVSKGQKAMWVGLGSSP